MSSILPLGRTYSGLASITTAARRVSLRDCAGIGIFAVGATAATAFTINEANAASGGTSQLVGNGTSLLRWWTMASGAGVWTAQTAAASGSINSIGTAAVLHYIWVPQGALSSGFSYLSASHATATMILVPGDLDVQRAPVNLRDLTA